MAAAPVVEPAESISLLPRRSGPDEHASDPGHGRRRSSHWYDAAEGADTAGADVRDGELLPDMTVEQFAVFLRTAHVDLPHPDVGQLYGAARQVIDLTEQHHVIDLRA